MTNTAATQTVHDYDDSVCDEPEGHVSDPDNICGHGFKIREVYV